MEARKSFSQRGFTLLELLIVVAILAIIGGALLVSYDDLDDKSSEGVAAYTLAALDSAVRNYSAVERSAPNYMDSLVAADYDAGALEDDTAPLANGEKVAVLPDKLMGSKTILVQLTQAQVDALAAAGITHLRYVDTQGNDPANPVPDSGGSVNLDVPNADGDVAAVGPLLNIDIPHRVHEVPRPGSGRNRGRGFAKRLAPGDWALQWNPDRSAGGGNYDNTKLGAGTDDVLFVFGLGNDCTMVGSSEGRTQLSSAPVFGKNSKRYEYGRYLLIFNVGPDGNEFGKAKFQLPMNTHGDFVDEMIAEHAGQKS